MVTHIIGLTGPIGGGKTTLLNNLRQRVNAEAPGRLASVAFSDPLRRMLDAFLPDTVSKRLTYAEQKVLSYHGLTGREWMIRWAEDMKSVNEEVLIQIAMAKVVDMVLADNGVGIVVLDGLGTHPELRRLREYTYLAALGQTTIIHCDEYATMRDKVTQTNSGKFVTDCRWDLSEYADLINPSIDEILAHIS